MPCDGIALQIVKNLSDTNSQNGDTIHFSARTENDKQVADHGGREEEPIGIGDEAMEAAFTVPEYGPFVYHSNHAYARTAMFPPGNEQVADHGGSEEEPIGVGDEAMEAALTVPEHGPFVYHSNHAYGAELEDSGYRTYENIMEFI